MTVHFYGLVHWEDPMEEALGPVPCQCSPAEGTITKEGMLHYKASTSYLGKEHWKACFVVLRWEPQELWAQAGVKSLARKAQGRVPPFPPRCGVTQGYRASLYSHTQMPSSPLHRKRVPGPQPVYREFLGSP